MTVGNRIKQTREQLGMSQSELAKRMGVTRQAISKAELCDDNITTDKVTKFANALGVTESYLMGWDDSQQVDNVITLPKDIELLIETYQRSDTTTQDIIKKILGLK